MSVENEYLHTIYDDLPISSQKNEKNKWSGYTDSERAIFNYFELNYELFERLFYLWREGVIDDKTWRLWENWVDRVIVIRFFRIWSMKQEICSAMNLKKLS